MIFLLDNHAPKGHHIHDFSGHEKIYKFVSIANLFYDFEKLIQQVEVKNENNENKNSF